MLRWGIGIRVSWAHVGRNISLAIVIDTVKGIWLTDIFGSINISGNDTSINPIFIFFILFLFIFKY